MLAEARLQALTGRYGEYLPEATADGADPTEYDSGYRYVAEGPHMNWAEKAHDDAVDAWKRDAGENPNMNGRYWTVRKLEF